MYWYDFLVVPIDRIQGMQFSILELTYATEYINVDCRLIKVNKIAHVFTYRK